MSSESAAGYAGDVAAAEAYRRLSSERSSVLIDVRTQAEWGYVGVPDPGRSARLFLEWQSFPAMQVDPGFATRLTASWRPPASSADAPLLFLCGPAPDRGTRRPP